MVIAVKFIKENSYDIVKLMVNQIGITIFSLVLQMAVLEIKDDAILTKVMVVVSAFATLFYFALIYTAAWDYGARDKIRIDGGKLTATPAKGLLLSLIANIPNFLMASLAVISMIIFLANGADGAYSFFAVINLFLRFSNAMFLGIIQGVFSFLKSDVNISYLWQSVGYLIAPVITALVTHLGYEMGLRELRIFKPAANNSSK